MSLSGRTLGHHATVTPQPTNEQCAEIVDSLQTSVSNPELHQPETVQKKPWFPKNEPQDHHVMQLTESVAENLAIAHLERVDRILPYEIVNEFSKLRSVVGSEVVHATISWEPLAVKIDLNYRPNNPVFVPMSDIRSKIQANAVHLST